MAHADKLESYRRKRSFEETPEPGGDEPGGGGGNRFVIQEHHARRLHWDLRLERDGVLVSWALPRGVPKDPDADRLAVHTEDHPLSYIDFHGEIPAGQYGAGTMTIWDSGTYEAEKFEDEKVVATFDGERVTGRYALFQTRGDDWMIHRMDPAPDGWQALPFGLEVMRPEPGRLPRDDSGWGFEVRWTGRRALAYCEPGHLTLLGADGEDLTSRFGEIRGMLEGLDGRDALLDGVIVAFGDDGRPDRGRLGRRLEAGSDSALRRLRGSTPATFVAFDLLHHDGAPLLDERYEDRRERLDALGLEGPAWQAPAYHRGDGKALLAASSAQGLEGIVGKKLDSRYRPGSQNRDWREIAPR